MKRHITLAWLTLTLTALAISTASATATLPSVLFLSGVKSGTLEAASKTAATKFVGITNITGTGYRFNLTDNAEMTSLGPALLWFLAFIFGAKKCRANGDTAGNILIPGLWHTVLAATGGGANLFLILFLISPSLTMECEGTDIVITGSELWDAEPLDKEVTAFTAATGNCSGNRMPAFVDYLNDAATSEAVGLKSETGGLKSATCLEVEGTQNYTASQMTEVMEP